MIPQLQTVKLTKGQVLYVPCGWFIIESVDKGPLCFGIRKSMFINSASDKAAYGKAKDMLAKNGAKVFRAHQELRLLLLHQGLHWVFLVSNAAYRLETSG